MRGDRRRDAACVLAAIAVAAISSPAIAGPPYLTDDPAPTETGHWEIYALTEGEGHRAAAEGDLGVDLNYGAAPGVQLSATLPLGFSHGRIDGWRSGAGDIDLGVKYRFTTADAGSFSAAVFPAVTLPTSSLSPHGRTRLFLPLWLEQDLGGGTSIFGAGGYEINPGRGNRNFWEAGLAVTHDVSKSFSLGAEVIQQSRDTAEGTGQTRFGIGTSIKLSEHYELLYSGGPTWVDHRTSCHFYAALGLDF